MEFRQMHFTFIYYVLNKNKICYLRLMHLIKKKIYVLCTLSKNYNINFDAVNNNNKKLIVYYKTIVYEF